MKRNLLPAIALLSFSLLAACSTAPAVPESPALESGAMLNASFSSSITPINSTGRRWATSVFLLDSDAQRQLMPLKTSCGGKSLRWTANAVMLDPEGIDLRASAGFARMPDVTFTSDCSRVLAIGTDAEDEMLDIWSYDITKKLWMSVTVDLSPKWVDVLVDKPAPYFLYPIDRHQVLVAAQNPTTGGDAYSNLSSLGILSLSKGTIDWLHPGGGLNPVIYDVEKRILTFFDYESTGDEGSFKLTRTDVALPQKKPSTVTLLSSGIEQDIIDGLYGGVFYCILDNYAGDAGAYEQCMDDFWERAFPAA